MIEERMMFASRVEDEIQKFVERHLVVKDSNPVASKERECGRLHSKPAEKNEKR